MKILKNQLKTLMDLKHEAGSNIISQALASKTVSRNEIQEMTDSKIGVINHETFYYSLKQLGETLGLQNQKFMDLNPNPVFQNFVANQKENIAMRIQNEIID